MTRAGSDRVGTPRQPITCSACKRPKAAAADLIRFYSSARSEDRCWADCGDLLRSDEQTADADFLRARLVKVRREYARYACDLINWYERYGRPR